MKKNIYSLEFKMNLRSVVIWSIAVAIMLLMFISIITSIAEEAELMNEMMSEFPPELLMAFGMENMDFASTMGIYSFAIIFVQIGLAIQAAYYGFSLVSVEERELTADFLLAKPVGRSQIMTSKLLAAISGLLITNLVVWICSFLFLEIFAGDRIYDSRILILLLLSLFIFQLFFLSVGLLISLLVKRVRSVTPYAMALAFGMYVLSVFGDMLGESILENMTPFKHFDSGYIVANAGYNTPLVSISLFVIVVSLVASFLLYRRRNIPAPV